MIGKSIRQFSGEADKGVKWWFAQLDRGIKRRKREEKRWDKNEEFEDLKQWSGAFGSGDQVTVNKVGSFIRTHRAAVAFRNPRAKMIPRKASGYEPVMIPEVDQNGQPKIDPMTGQVVARPVVKATAREQLFNSIVSQPLFGLTDTISRLDKASLMGYGALMCGYRPEFETAPKIEGEDKIPVDPDGQLDFSQFQVNPVTGMPMEDDNGRLIRKAQIPVWEDWFIDWVSYRKIIIDPDGENDFMQHRWVAIEVVRNLDEVKADPLFKNTKGLKSTGEYDEDDERARFTEWLEGEDEEDKAKQVRLFHIYDFVKDQYIVLADGHGKYLRKERTPEGITHSPLAFLRYDETLDEFYPRPRVSDLAPINEWYNESRRLELVGMKASLRKPIIEEGRFTDEELEKLTNDVDMQVVLRKASAYPGPSVEMFTPPPVNGTIYQASASASGDFDEIAGSPEARGKASADTATQSNNLMQGESLRNEFERVLMKNCILEIFKKLNDSIDANMTIERAVELIGSDGQTFVGLVDRDMIAGDFDIEIDVQDLAPSDDMAMGAQRIQLLQMAGSYPHQFSDITRAKGWCELYKIRDENFIKSLVEGAQMQIQMMMIEAQPPMPNAAPPGNQADAASQSGAGQQIPAMQGAQ